MKTHVTLIAVAKDEACYIHEWIYHHLYMGFDSIIVGVNRTTDETIEILNKINTVYGNCIYEIIDWMDKIPPYGRNEKIQKLAYSYLSNIANKKYSPTHVMYLDIDEFWFSVDFTKINNLLLNSNKFDVMSFNWASQMGEDEAFTPPFKNQYFIINKHVKSLVSSKIFSKINYFRCHSPMIKSSYIHLDSNGQEFNAETNNNQPLEFSKNILNAESKYYILHRMVRSEYEYLSSLFRGNPEGEFIKENRNGFRKNSGEKWNLRVPAKYYKLLDQFIHSCELENIIKNSRKVRLSYYKKINEVCISVLCDECKVLNKTLKGTFLHDVFIKRIINETSDIETLRILSLLEEDKRL